MPKPNWSRSAINALDLLYRARWRWAAIAAHVSGIDGIPRSTEACRLKAKQCGLIDPANKGVPAVTEFDDDLRDMMVLDFSSHEMREELEAQYGRPFNQSWVHSRLKAIGGNYYAAWQRRGSDRISRRTRRALAFRSTARRAAA